MAVTVPGDAGGQGCTEAVSAAEPIVRLAGANRYATAACAAEFAFPDGAEHVLLARGDDTGALADAFAGAVLADARDAPVLLTARALLPSATAAELVRLAPATVTVLGGTAAVSERVARDLVDLLGPDVTIERLAGDDRAETAAAVSRAAGAAGTAFVVHGGRPSDSLIAAAPAARTGSHLLLVTSRGVPAATRAALEDVDEIIIIGGYGVVSAATERSLRTLHGGEVRRIAGRNRAATAAAVARALPADGAIHLAAGEDARLVDAVTAGWLAAREGGGPVLYSGVDAPAAPTARWLRLGGLAASPDLRLVGGESVLGSDLVPTLEAFYDEGRRGGPPAETRGVWVHLFDPTLKSREGIHRMLDNVEQAGGNLVIAQVARRQDAYYTSEVLPRTPDPQLEADLDLLATLVPAAHDRGLDVHAWVSVLPAYHSVYDRLTLPPEHVWRRHGPGSAESWTTRDVSGAHGVYLDPGVPAVQAHVAAMMAEIAGRYDVDAVHLDYLRYEGSRWGYHPTSLARFRSATGVTGTPEPTDPAWGAWRRQQTRELARTVAAAVREADPAVGVSIAASTMGPGPDSAGGYTQTRTYREVFQDWPAWLAAGTIDAAYPMNYFREDDARERRWFDDWTTWQAGLDTGSGVLAVGQGSWLNSLDGSLAQHRRGAARSAGTVVYSYQQSSRAGVGQQLLGRLADDLWAEPAPAPQLGGRSAP